VPFADLAWPEEPSGGDEPYPESHYLPATHPTEPQHWSIPPARWPTTPEEALLSSEVRGRLKATILGLPRAQREVLTLRDVEGLSADEVCNVLGLSETNQRVILHRARTRVRKALEGHFLRE
jgi:RNA polymerase sigma-70 factor (ECF subfamily)